MKPTPASGRPAGDSAASVTQAPVALEAWLASVLRLDFWRLEVDVLFSRPVSLELLACATVRGLFGASLRRLRCLTGMPSCRGCAETSRCDYAAVFGTEGAAESMPGGLADLRPYWLQGLPAEPRIAAGSRGTARLMTTGIDPRLLPALDVAFREGLGCLGEEPGRRRDGAPHLSASRTDYLALPTAADGASRWWVEARTPLLLTPPKRDGALVRCPAAPWLSLVLWAGARRLRGLMRKLVPGSDPPPVAFPDLEDVEVVTAGFGPWNGRHFSQRQRREFPLEHGLVGGAQLRGSAMPVVGRLLQVLALTGVGKKTTHGFGELVVEPLA